MIEWGEVKDIKNGIVQILLDSPSCRNCHFCASKKRIIKMKEEKGLKIGDKVKIDAPEGKFSVISFINFGIPVLFLLIGAIFSSNIFQNDGKMFLFTISIFFLGLIVSQIILRFFLKKFFREIKILEVIRK